MKKQKTSFKLKRHQLALSCLALGAPAFTHAQTTAADPAALPTVVIKASGDLQTTESSGSYGVIETRAGLRLPLSLRETPQSVTVITRQRIEDQQLDDITQVMQQTPGISVQPQDSERVNYYSRGFLIDSVMYDGIPSTLGAYSGNGKTQSDTAIYDRVEIVRGATGLMNGTGNPGASINLVRKKPTSTFQASGSVGIGSWSRKRTELDVSGPLNALGTLRGRVVGAYSDGNSSMDYYSKKRAVGYGVVELDVSRGTLLTIGFDAQDNKAKGVTWGGLPALFSDGTRTDFPRSFSTATSGSFWNENTNTLFATLEHKLGNGWKVNTTYSHYRSGMTAELSAWGGWAVRGVYPDKTTGLNAFQFPGTFHETDRTNALDVYASGKFELGGREHEAVFGFSGRRKTHVGETASPLSYPALSSSIYTWNHKDALPAFGTPEHYTGTDVDLGAYGALRFKPAERLAVIIGSRIANYSRQQDNTNAAARQYVPYDYRKSGVVTPYAGVVYDLDEQHSLYASYTTVYNPQDHVDVNGAPLKPLKGKVAETGLKGEYLDGALTGAAAVFQANQDNVAQAAGTTGTTTYYTAASGVRTRGFELEMTGRPTAAWNVSAAFTRQVAEDGTGARINPDRPQSMLRLFSTFRLPGAWSRLTLGGGVEWNGATFTHVTTPTALQASGSAATTRLDYSAYALANLMARYDITPRLSASLTINNAFDRKYYAGTSFYSNVIYGAPRNAMLTLRWRM